MLTTDILRLLMGDAVSGYHSDGLGSYNISRFLSIYRQMEFLPDTVYIGSVRDLPFLPSLLLKKPAELRITLVIAMSFGEHLPALSAPGTSVIYSSLELPACIDLIHLSQEKYAKWINELSTLEQYEPPLQRLVNLTTELIPYPSFINCYAKNYSLSDTAINLQLAERISRTLHNDDCAVVSENGVCHIARMLRLNNVVCMRLFVFSVEQRNAVGVQQLLENIVDALQLPPMLKRLTSYYSDELAAVFHALLDHKISDPEELSARMAAAGFDKFSPCFIGMIRSSSYTPLYPPQFFSELSELLPGTQIIQMGDYILLLLKCGDISAKPEIDFSGMQQLLEKRKMRLAFSYPLKSVLSLPIICDQLSSTLRFAEIIRREGNGRIHYFHDYDIYHIIESCATSGEYAYHPSTLRNLIEPTFFKITKYDHDYNSNLVDTLRTYYQLGSNASETARVLHYHRNTVIKKLDKISSILDEDINGTDFKWRMQVAFAVEDYITKLCNLPPDFDYIS